MLIKLSAKSEKLTYYAPCSFTAILDFEISSGENSQISYYVYKNTNIFKIYYYT